MSMCVLYTIYAHITKAKCNMNSFRPNNQATRQTCCSQGLMRMAENAGRDVSYCPKEGGEDKAFRVADAFPAKERLGGLSRHGPAADIIRVGDHVPHELEGIASRAISTSLRPCGRCK